MHLVRALFSVRSDEPMSISGPATQMSHYSWLGMMEHTSADASPPLEVLESPVFAMAIEFLRRLVIIFAFFSRLRRTESVFHRSQATWSLEPTSATFNMITAGIPTF